MHPCAGALSAGPGPTVTAPESNPDEYLNRDFKTALRTGAVSRDPGELLEKATAFMNMLCSMPERISAYFRHPCATYATKDI